MQPTLTVRFLAGLAVAALAACSTNGGNTAGQTPAPSNTSMAQANSTAAPDQAMSKGPGQKYFAKTAADDGVQFAIWANGTPITTIQWPNKSVDITPSMRGHANTIAIRWTKTKKNGTGTLMVTDFTGKTIVTAHVTAKSPTQAGISKTFIAPQMPAQRGGSTGP